MSQAPRRINTQRSLNRPTEQRPTEAPLKGQPDFFQEEPSVPHVEPVSYTHLTLPTTPYV